MTRRTNSKRTPRPQAWPCPQNCTPQEASDDLERMTRAALMGDFEGLERIANMAEHALMRGGMLPR